jgi:hypothetical protein
MLRMDVRRLLMLVRDVRGASWQRRQLIVDVEAGSSANSSNSKQPDATAHSTSALRAPLPADCNRAGREIKRIK